MTDAALAGEVDRNCINCWSTTRSLGAALMYAFAQRSDAQVLDEPLYANYLRITGAERPYRSTVMEQQDPDGNMVVNTQILAPRKKKVLFVKHVAKQRIGIGSALMARSAHVILVREPIAVIQSMAKIITPTLAETGYTSLVEIVSELRTLGQKPVVIMSEDLMHNPKGTLQAMCSALGLDFDDNMLEWAAGRKPYEGCWANWWYKRLHQSQGFEPTKRAVVEAIPPAFKPLVAECRPFYEVLRSKALAPVVAVPKALSMARSASAMTGMGGSSNALVHSMSNTSLGERRSGIVTAADEAASTPGAPDPPATDPRNLDMLVGMRDSSSGAFSMVWYPDAKLPVLDSGLMHGDGIWEAIWLHKGVLMDVEEHIKRVYEGTAALGISIGVSPKKLQLMMYQTVDANGLSEASDVCIRLTVTRGQLASSRTHPSAVAGIPSIIILPEYLPPHCSPASTEAGLKLMTSHLRCSFPAVHPERHSLSQLTSIAAHIAAHNAGADDALLLDPSGSVATCCTGAIMIVHDGAVWVPPAKYAPRSVARGRALALCEEHGIPVHELEFGLAQVYSADEMLVCSTVAGLVPVDSVDGRSIGGGLDPLHPVPRQQRAGTLGTLLAGWLEAALELEASVGRLVDTEDKARKGIALPKPSPEV